MVYKLSPEAYDVFREFQSWYEDAKQDERVLESSVEFMTAFGKLEGTTGRLILVLHLMDAPFAPMVAADTVRRAIDLVRGYVIPAVRYAVHTVGMTDVQSFDQWVTDWVIHTAPDKLTVNLRDIKRSARRPLEGKTDWQKQQMIADAMDTLEAARWVVKLEDEPNKQHLVWALNPSLGTMFADYRLKVLKAKQRHADYIYRIAAATPGSKYSGRKLIKGYDPETMDD
jgi:hypothetical protein